MNYKVLREVFDPYTNDKLGNFGAYSQYKLIATEAIVGEFFYKNVVSYFSINDDKYKIPTEKPLLGKAIHQILNADTGVSVATLKISYWRQVFFNEIGTLTLSNKIYTFKRSRVRIIKSPFLSFSTVAVDFFTTHETDSILYSATYQANTTSDSSYNFRPVSDFMMEISSLTDKDILLYSGLFLIEKFFRS